MSAHPHKLSQYESEYRVWTEFCKVCGAEGIALLSPCPGNKKPVNGHKIVDTDKEPS